jgi:putative ABC transport system permease protein
MEILFSDVRYALRSLRQNLPYTVIAVVCLALGIGVNTTIYSVVNAMLLRPLEVGEPGRMIRVYQTNARMGATDGSMSLATIAEIAAQSTMLTGVAGYVDRDVALGGHSESEQSRRVQSELVSWNLFSLLGIQPALGRSFVQGEASAGREHVAIISDKVWREAFAADRTILGQPILLDGTPYAVIGVMPPGMRFPETRDIWTPAVRDLTAARGPREFNVVARLAPGVSVQQASSEMNGIIQRDALRFPRDNSGAGGRAIPFRDSLPGDFRVLLWTMLGAVTFVLLIACGNVANLMLARATSRQREIAVRTALGATRGRLVRQVLTESILISLIGGVLGVLIAAWGLDLVVKAIPYELPYWVHLDIDRRVLFYTLAISIGTGCLFGLGPAIKSTSPDLNETLKDGSRGTTVGSRHQRLRGGLVVGETALCLVLLIGATLMMRSFVRMNAVDAGFRTEGVLSADIMLPLSRYPTAPRRLQFFAALRDRLTASPGVKSVAITSYSPLSGSSMGTNYLVEGVSATEDRQPVAELRAVSGGYFNTLDIPLRTGRTFTPAEDLDSLSAVVVVNQTLVDRHFANASAIGKRIRWGWTGTWLTIIGVVPDVRQHDLKDKPTAQIYLPQSLLPRRTMSLLVRTDGDASALAPAVRAALGAIDPVVPAYDVMTLDALRSRSMWQSRVFGAMFAVFGVVALVLAAIGLYGVISYGVAQRMHELGVRMALGAQSNDVLNLIVSQGSRLALSGVLVGLPLAFAVTRALRSQLYGVSVTDPLSYVGISVLLAGIALVASYIPARRAARADPMVALRGEY